MKVQNTTIFMGDDTLRARHGKGVEKSEGKNIFAGNLNPAIDPIAQKRQDARQQAMKIVGDAWASDQKVDDDLALRRENIRNLQSEIGKANDELKKIEDQRVQLRDHYGVTEDSKEEQDLKLLAKEMDAKKPGSGVSLTKEEREQIAQIKKDGLSEYQSRFLEMKENGKIYEDQIEEASAQIRMESAIITGTKLEMLKHQGMTKAQKAADDVMEAASDQIVGMLMEEAKDHIDEEMEEQKELAEERAEKKEELEERTQKNDEEDAREKALRDQIGDSTKLMTESEDVMDDVQRELKKIVDKMKLLEEDIKGAAVDTMS